MSEEFETLPWSHPVAVREIAGRKPFHFDIKADAPTREAISKWADLSRVRDLRLKGTLIPVGRRDLRLEATLTADVAQFCVVTLAPVPAKVNTEVLRRYLSDWQEPTGEEVEIPEDDTSEPLPQQIDLAAVALEALELSLPLYPRAQGASLDETVVTEPGQEPLREKDLKPFANLKAMMDKKDEGA